MFENLVSRAATKRPIPANFADGALAFASTTGNALSSAAASATVLPKIQRPSNISKVIGYLMWRAGLESGLPVGHTYKTAAP